MPVYNIVVTIGIELASSSWTASALTHELPYSFSRPGLLCKTVIAARDVTVMHGKRRFYQDITGGWFPNSHRPQQQPVSHG